jgi:hypothetical protein
MQLPNLLLNLLALTGRSRPSERLPSTQGHEGLEDRISSFQLPNTTLFPGPWESYIQAPANKTFIQPVRVWNVSGTVTNPEGLLADAAGEHVLTLGEDGLVTYEFAQNIGGR